MLTWWPLCHTHFRLFVKKSMVEFLSNDLKAVENYYFPHGTHRSFVYRSVRAKTCLWREELLDPTGQKRFVEDAADGRTLPGVAFEQLCQQGAQFLGVVDGNGGVRASDDLQNKVLHVASLKLRRIQIRTCLELQQRRNRLSNETYDKTPSRTPPLSLRDTGKR